MTEPQGVVPETPATPVAAPRKRLVWPWVLGGSLLLFVLAVGVAVIVFALSAFTAARSSQAQTAAVEKVVNEFDAAYADADCDAFEAVTNKAVRDDAIVDGEYTCSAWIDVAESFVVDGDYSYEVEINDTEVHGRTATVVTTESWDDGEGGTESDDYEYTLKHGDDGWIIVKYDTYGKD